MNDGLIPRRYAKALLKYAQEKGADKRMYLLMQTLAASFDSEPELCKAITNPFVDAASKTKLLTTASGATDKDTVFADFIKLLLENNRIDIIRMAALAYLELYRKANNIFLVEITSAAPLGDSEMKRLRDIIEKHVGDSTVEYHTAVDPDLIGGFVVKIDSERLDASVKNELKQLRLNLLSK